MSEIISALINKIDDDDTRQDIYDELIPIFEAYGADELEECCGEDESFELAFRSHAENKLSYGKDEEDPDVISLEDLDEDEGFSVHDPYGDDD